MILTPSTERTVVVTGSGMLSLAVKQSAAVYDYSFDCRQWCADAEDPIVSVVGGVGSTLNDGGQTITIGGQPLSIGGEGFPLFVPVQPLTPDPNAALMYAEQLIQDVITVYLAAGVPGVSYAMVLLASTLGGRTLPIYATLPIDPATPGSAAPANAVSQFPTS